MNSTALLLVELVVLFIGVSFFVEIMQRRVGPDRLQAWMGGRPTVAAIKGIVIGFVTPFCTYSAIPLLVGLRRAGVAPAGYIAFISAAPVLDPILFGALWLIVGPAVALTYVIVTFAAAFSLALIAQRIGVERHLRPLAALVPARSAVGSGSLQAKAPADVSGCTSPAHPWQGWRLESPEAFRVSAALLRSFGPLLLLGITIGLLIDAVLSPETAAGLTTGSPWLSIPIASALGTPLYFSTELLVPIANSLSNAGVGAGAIVALTIAGAGANLPEFVVLSKMARPGAVSVFFGYVFGVAMTGGLLAHVLTA